MYWASTILLVHELHTEKQKNAFLYKAPLRKGGQLSNGTIEYIYRVLKNILERSKEWGLIKVNPIVGVKKPKVEQPEIEFYDDNEAKEVITALNEEPRKWRLFILGSMIGGFRRGELLALE
ncbi:phage integrase-like protein [Paenibacillus larvae subsp. larvae]|uniref:Phage integrase-like protein n=1 Tax=Paenibacillus larvae subsp. larvae TaxID=147375 RepID=A0A2L1TY98_9BACL|nr:hypothetical protein [Paenibacillus larvae]AVF25588.1 phage integrase-like protein [Paenibacillus larvae subsp. larvae]AVF30365.1 phage integrase-like protein [Paenibacillus larvae subsp. larvae]MCY9525444.1 hypothetical protein [Paenibacillus larvae]MCY9681234.1 hypothetical protein [Paenibacillus larvae]MCY9744115.1 hypothetical protein [Paenibacillus larvae]